MSVNPQEFVCYSPPKSSSFGHQTRTKKARLAWVEVEAFLAQFADFKLRDNVELSCQREMGEGRLVSEQFRAHIESIFGPPSRPDRDQWLFPAARLHEALSAGFEEDLWPRQSFGPAWLTFCYDFVWKEMRPAPIPLDPWGRSPTSNMLNVILRAQRLFLQPIFVFPGPYTDKTVVSFIHSVQKAAPFPIRDQYFKRMIPTKSGRFRYLKLQEGWMGEQ